MVWQWKTLLKWMIWGYHYFRKHPVCVYIVDSFVVRTQLTTSPSVNMLRGEMQKRHGFSLGLCRPKWWTEKESKKKGKWLNWKRDLPRFGGPLILRHIAVFLLSFLNIFGLYGLDYLPETPLYLPRRNWRLQRDKTACLYSMNKGSILKILRHRSSHEWPILTTSLWATGALIQLPKVNLMKSPWFW